MILDTSLFQASQPMSLIEELKLKELTFANNTLFRFLNERCQQLNSNTLLQVPTPVETPLLKSVSPMSNSDLASPAPITPLEFNTSQSLTTVLSSTSSSPISSPSTSISDSGVESAEEHNRRPHECGVCHKKFRFKSNLFEHKTLHSLNQHQFSCPYCMKTCRLKGNLKKHLQVHVTNSEALEALWKARFSRSSGRPRKQVTTQVAPTLQQQQLPNPLPTYSVPVQAPQVMQQTAVDFRQALFDLNSLNSLLNFNAANPQLLASAFNRL